MPMTVAVFPVCFSSESLRSVYYFELCETDARLSQSHLIELCSDAVICLVSTGSNLFARLWIVFSAYIDVIRISRTGNSDTNFVRTNDSKRDCGILRSCVGVLVISKLSTNVSAIVVKGNGFNRRLCLIVVVHVED